MYNPCFECLIRYGRKYSKDCIDICVFAHQVHEIKIQVKEISELIDKRIEPTGLKG